MLIIYLEQEIAEVAAEGDNPAGKKAMGFAWRPRVGLMTPTIGEGFFYTLFREKIKHRSAFRAEEGGRRFIASDRKKKDKHMKGREI